MDHDATRTGILDAAEELFYAQGIQTVRMDAVRSASGVTLRRLYQYFPSKGELVEAYLLRRDGRWREELAAHVVGAAAGPGGRILAVFDWLADWFAQPDFRGCAFVNAFGELGATAPEVAAAARHHKDEFAAYLAGLAEAAGAPPATGAHLTLLAEGAITAAAIRGDATPAAEAKGAARVLLRAAGVQGVEV
ncbi:helix-turn-helix domain containing protein [Streptomyces sp. SP17BM10]|uniref:TetR/AcrR family transcriptional regulator n=1 Tax=Streptomyces sp. SP17BM10 TaxID=3002530 RepID=UPI002E783BE7|nr:helix-turn-helix domain-containing protein [Streptomyces sp. SP17BM10]MEE1788456.1 helix-turn-helix domain containing protein [Streptomyces sp. SP17BM10]